MARIIVSYDGTNNEDDAIALGRVFASVGADVSLAYVRHARAADAATEQAQQQEAERALERGADLLGDTGAQRHVVVDRSTPAGLAALAEREGADLVVFCSDSHTAPGHVTVGNSAQRLLEDGTTAVAIAPAGYAQTSVGRRPVRIAATGADGDSSARDTAQSLAESFSASVAEVTAEDADLVVIGSRPEAAQGRVSINAASEYLIELSRSPVLVIPRGTPFTLDTGTRTSETAGA
jgi:nucleotide-binding universal stress UspA family protein